jgi:hypothetical protein
MKHMTLALALFATTTAHAQNWIVGQPVDMQVSSIAVYGGGCWPDLQAHLNFGLPAVAGVTYYYLVTDIIDGTYTVTPGPAGPLSIGDTITIHPAQETLVYNEAASGGLFMQVWATGTPTTAGQVHPCVMGDLWMSNLLLCFEGLNCLLQTNCTTEISNAIDAAMPNDALSFTLPTAGNGYQLQVNGAASVRVVDMQGRVVATEEGTGLRMHLGALPAGAYLLHMERNGQVRTERVVVAR